MESTDFNFFYYAADAPKTAPIFPSSATVPPSSQVTSLPASQPGSQKEQIAALQGLDEPPASQEQKAEDLEDSEKTPEQSFDYDTKLSTFLTPGSEFSSKKKGKRVISKKGKKGASTAGDEAEVDLAESLSPSSPTRPTKLITRPGKNSKGGKKGK